jgi:hypothetical protein
LLVFWAGESGAMQAEAANATSDRSFVLSAIRQAAQATGADFNYLLGTAMRESGLKPSIKAGTSSAAGLFQFIEQTWLGVVKSYGARHGLGSYANAISKNADGSFRASNPADRSAILALRNNPQVAALMEGEMAQATRATLQNALGRDVCGGELYAAHFLGPDAACRLIRMSDSHPDASAANAFPAAADANKSVFYHSDGTSKTVREVYDWALKQPNASAGFAGTAPKAENRPLMVDSASDIDSHGLLLCIASWRPTHGFFSSDTAAPSSASVVLSPAVMDMLQSIDPARS